jgi:hypothetical protein
MAKGKREKPEQKPSRSVLQLAWDRFEAGDVVEARRLANAVLQGTVGADEPEAATRLARQMSGDPSLAVPETVDGVARAIIARTRPLPRSYLFAALALTVLGLLVTLALTRYAA